jgi:hypothetical protein
MMDTCPECGSDVGGRVAGLKDGEIDTSRVLRLCTSVHCDWKKEV